MGVWLTGALAMGLVATQNFHTIDRLLADPSNTAFRDAITRIGEGPAHELLGYLASELNRFYLQWWNVAQIVLALVTLWLLRPLGRGNRAGWLVLGMLGVVVFVSFGLTPATVRIGREIDFIPREPLPHALRTVGLLHAAYSVLAFINVILGVQTIRTLCAAGERKDAGAGDVHG
jgi:hypothetical protein